MSLLYLMLFTYKYKSTAHRATMVAAAAAVMPKRMIWNYTPEMTMITTCRWMTRITYFIDSPCLRTTTPPYRLTISFFLVSAR